MTKTPSQKHLTEEERLSLAQRLREMVEAIGTQPKAADTAQVSLRALEQYLSGKVAPPLIATSNLAKATGFSIDWVITGKGKKMREATPNPMTNPRDASVAKEPVYQGILSDYQRIRDVCSALGFPIESRADDDAVIIRISNLLEETELPEDQHPAVTRAIARAFEIVLDFCQRKKVGR